MSDDEVRALEREAAADPAAIPRLWLARLRRGDLSGPLAAVDEIVRRAAVVFAAEQGGGPLERDEYLFDLAMTIRGAFNSGSVEYSWVVKGHRVATLAVFESGDLVVGVRSRRTRSRDERNHTLADFWPVFRDEPFTIAADRWARQKQRDRVRLPRPVARALAHHWFGAPMVDLESTQDRRSP